MAGGTGPRLAVCVADEAAGHDRFTLGDLEALGEAGASYFEAHGEVSVHDRCRAPGVLWQRASRALTAVSWRRKPMARARWFLVFGAAARVSL
jgi:hypothetical protein